MKKTTIEKRTIESFSSKQMRVKNLVSGTRIIIEPTNTMRRR